MLLTAILAGPASAPTAIAAPAADEQTSAFLSRLLDEINARRQQAGTQPLTSVPPDATAALDGFFAQTLPELAWPEPCMHHLVNGEGSWSYVLSSGFGGDFRGEVLACPGPEPYWTPNRVAEEWWSSPSHFEVLYGDPDANAVACSVAGVQGARGGSGRNRGGSRAADAASAVLCVTFHAGGASSGARAESMPFQEPPPVPTWQAEADDGPAATLATEPEELWEAEAVEEPAELEAESESQAEAESPAADGEPGDETGTASEPEQADVSEPESADASEAEGDDSPAPEPGADQETDAASEPGAIEPGGIAAFGAD